MNRTGHRLEMMNYSALRGITRGTPKIKRLERIGDGWSLLIAFMRAYPDFLIDLCRGVNADYPDETLIQRIIMRVKARYRHVCITGCRGLTKTSTTFKEEMCEMALYPGIRASYYGPTLKQMSKIGSLTYHQLEHDYPVLAKSFLVKAESVDRFEIVTRYFSSLAIAAMRGDTIHKVIAEEFAQEPTARDSARFDAEKYKSVVLPAVRGQYMINGQPDPAYIRFKKHSITSAGRRQNYAYESRRECMKLVAPDKYDAFVMDVPYDIVLLLKMRPIEWAEDLKHELSPEEWAREMDSRYTGADENPIVSDETLSESRCLLSMEEHHCCKDADNKLDPKDVFYIIGYDVSYEDGSKNAKCACVVVKCTKQTDYFKRDKYMNQVVWVNDWSPTDFMSQARKLKSVWNRYCVEGSMAYISIDNWQYGSSVRQSLMMDLQDGLAPLCIYNHEQYTEFELENAIPCIYPIKAGGVGTTDPDAEMIRNAEMLFEHRSVQLLTGMSQSGLEAYKTKHRIKDDTHDYAIVQPYKKTDELVNQIMNLKRVPNTAGVAEKRISNAIQRDSWSALKYALRLSQILARKNLLMARRKSDWDEELKKYKNATSSTASAGFKSRIPFKREGGRHK